MNAISMDHIHPSVAPCKDWGTPHQCYACACASASLGSINNIAVALESHGIKCLIDQTGGMTMVGVAILSSGATFSWNEEYMLESPVPYDHEDYEYSGEVLVIAEEEDGYDDPQSDYASKVVETILGKVGE